eukprot:scaffold93751_cov63-Phaeocystis_antarctica.AAC.3
MKSAASSGTRCSVAERPVAQPLPGSRRAAPAAPPPEWSKAGNRRLGRWLARAPEAVAGRPEGRPLPGSAELPRAARCALWRHRSRAGALPRLHFDYAAPRLAPPAAGWPPG